MTQKTKAPLLRRLIGIVARKMSPGYSWCHCCGRPWSVCKGHRTYYSPSRACFPLCEQCWAELTPTQRLPFYRQLWDEWLELGADTPAETWGRIHQAVIEGK